MTMRTPGEDIELVVGFLFSEGIIPDGAEVRSVGAPSDRCRNIVVIELAGSNLQARLRAPRNFLMTSACGVFRKASLRDLEASACPVIPQDEIQLEPDIIHRLTDRLRQAQSAFDATGGLHAAARFNLQGELESLREDVGRHNALDKLIGAAVLHLHTVESFAIADQRAGKL
jgi:FdhD protein